jgi:hypothetical protein
MVNTLNENSASSDSNDLAVSLHAPDSASFALHMAMTKCTFTKSARAKIIAALI